MSQSSNFLLEIPANHADQTTDRCLDSYVDRNEPNRQQQGPYKRFTKDGQTDARLVEAAISVALTANLSVFAFLSIGFS